MAEQLYTRAATLGPRTLNLENRTVEAIISSGSRVLRRGPYPDGNGFGPWHEQLNVDGADLSRLIGGPVLLDHKLAESAARVGVVESVRQEGGQLIARLKFSARADVEPLLRDLMDGIGGQISISYEVSQWVSEHGA